MHCFSHLPERLIRNRRQIQHSTQASPFNKREIETCYLRKQFLQRLNYFGSDFFRRFKRIEHRDVSGNAGRSRRVVLETEALN